MQFFTLIAVFGLAAFAAAAPQEEDTSSISSMLATSTSAASSTTDMITSSASVSPVTTCLTACKSPLLTSRKFTLTSRANGVRQVAPIFAVKLPALVFRAPIKLKPTPPPNALCSATREMDPLRTRNPTPIASLPASARCSLPQQVRLRQPGPTAALPAILPLPQKAALVCYIERSAR